MRREDEQLVRHRQRGGAQVTAWLLGSLVVLIFAVAIVKIAFKV